MPSDQGGCREQMRREPRTHRNSHPTRTARGEAGGRRACLEKQSQKLGECAGVLGGKSEQLLLATYSEQLDASTDGRSATTLTIGPWPEVAMNYQVWKEPSSGSCLPRAAKQSPSCLRGADAPCFTPHLALLLYKEVMECL